MKLIYIMSQVRGKEIGLSESEADLWVIKPLSFTFNNKRLQLNFIETVR